MNVINTHWTPWRGVSCHVRSFCTITTSSDDPPPAPVPATVSRRVVIWQKDDCVACKASVPWFRAIETYGMTLAQPPFRVEHRQATADALRTFTHIQMVNTYDIVDSASTVTEYQPYGPNTTFTSIKNDRSALLAAFGPELERLLSTTMSTERS